VSRPVVLAALVFLASGAVAAAEGLPEPQDGSLDHLAPDTVQAFHLQWGWGDRGGEYVDVMYQIQGDGKGIVRAKETHFAGLTSDVWIDRQEPLTAADIREIRAAAEANDFWTITEPYGPYFIHDKDGTEALLLCGPATLTGVEPGRRHGVEACPEHNQRVRHVVQTMLSVAQRHAPGFAKNPIFWGQQ
jgi:hypothetical protein